MNLGGNTQIGNDVEIGIGASTLQGIHIENDVKVGGQAMVVKDIMKSTVVVGIRQKKLNQPIECNSKK